MTPKFLMYFPQTFVSLRVRRIAMALSLALPLSSALAQAAQQPMAVSASAAANGDTVLARGPGGAVITVNDVFSEFQRAPEQTRKIMMAKPDSIQQMASNLLVRRVLANEADRDGLGKDPLVAANVAISRERVLSDVRLAKLDTQNAPTEAALDAYARNLYKVNADKFEKPAQTRVRHILLANKGAESLDKAKALLAQLRSGASFEDLAKANSIDTSNAPKGGDLGFFAAGQMVRPFEDAVNKLAKPGDLSEPVETQFGYHLIKLEERREKGRQTYEEVRAQLLDEARTAILNESRVAKVQSMMKEVVFETATIEALAKSPAR
jgi:peptidyl-prolyl cis-trans isomerase C